MAEHLLRLRKVAAEELLPEERVLQKDPGNSFLGPGDRPEPYRSYFLAYARLEPVFKKEQVQSPLIATFTQAFLTKAKDFFLPQIDDTIHFDMWAALHWQLEESSILPEHVEGPTICTACRVDEFYSHRKEHGKTGRFASVIVLRA